MKLSCIQSQQQYIVHSIWLFVHYAFLLWMFWWEAKSCLGSERVFNIVVYIHYTYIFVCVVHLWTERWKRNIVRSHIPSTNKEIKTLNTTTQETHIPEFNMIKWNTKIARYRIAWLATSTGERKTNRKETSTTKQHHRLNIQIEIRTKRFHDIINEKEKI